ncbi:Ig-like domain (group 3) [Lachnospiraceae bacterium NE2001]|nr:Ig-like domain (group 3) [Lachnospiraceae bacterium NE2001]
MINKKSKGKEHIRRPLPVRAIAILLALAMVLSVVYINNRRDVVQAEGKISDDTFITKELLGFSESVTQRSIYVPYDSTGKVVEFSLPSYDSVEETLDNCYLILSNYSVMDGDSTIDISAGYYLNLPAGASASDTEHVAPVTLKKETGYVWFSGESAVTTVSSGSADSSVTLKYGKVRYKDSSDTLIFVNDAPADTYTDVGTLTIVHESLCDITFENDAADSSKINATEKTEDGKTLNESVRSGADASYYYGSVSYEVSDDPTEYPSLNELTTAYSGTDFADGSYTVTKKITVVSGGNKELLAQSESSLEKNTIFVNTVSASANDGAVTETINYSNSNSSIAISKVNAKLPVAVTIDTDIDFGNGGSCTISDLTGLTGTDVAVIYSGNIATVTIPGGIMTGGNSYGFKATVNNGTTDIKISVDIACGDGTPSWTGEGATNADGDSSVVRDSITYYKGKVKLYGNAAVTGSGALIARGDAFQKGTDGNYSTEACASKEYADSDKAESKDIEIEVPLTTEGLNTFKLSATSTYDDSAFSNEINVYNDTTGPAASYVGISQKNNAGGTYSDTQAGADAVAFATKISKKLPATITIGLYDTGCGLPGSGAVYYGGTALTRNSDGSYSYTIPANTDTTEFAFTLKDALGNETPLTATVQYFDEVVIIDSPKFVRSDSTEYNMYTGNFITWTGTAVADKSQRDYRVIFNIKSDAEIQIPTGFSLTNTQTGTGTPSFEYKGIEDGYYKYVVTTSLFSGSTSVSNTITLTATNVNGYSTTATVENSVVTVNIDSDGPKFVSVKDQNNVVLGDDPADWYQTLTLTFVVNDNTGTPTSGIKDVNAISGVKTLDKSGLSTADADGNYSFVAEINNSTFGTPTSVEIQMEDNVGNLATYTNNFKVDDGKPVLTLTIDDKNYDEVKGLVLSEDPIIKYSWSDAISDLASQSIEITDGTTTWTKNDTSYNNQKLSDIIGSKADPDKDYYVTVTATDNANNTEQYKTNFRVDNDRPVIGGSINNTSKKSAYPIHFAEDVSVTVTVTDSNLTKLSNLSATDNNGNALDVSWTQSGKVWTGNIKATAEGDYKVNVHAKDDGGLENDWSVSFTIDKTAPTIRTFLDDKEYTEKTAYKAEKATSKMTVSDPRNGEDTADERVTVTLTTPTGETRTEVKEGKGPFTFNEDGVYTLKYEAIDKAGNPAEKTIGFTVDGAKPVHNIYVSTSAAKTAKFSNTYSNKVGKFTDYSDQEEYTYGQYFNTDVFIDVSYFDYNMETATVYDNGNPISVNWGKKDGYGRGTIAISSEGYHTIWIESIDKSGNVVNDKTDGHSVSFTIDKTSPILITYLNGEGYVDTTAYTSSAAAEVAVTDDNDDAEDITIKVERQIPGGDTVTSTIYGSKTVNLTEDGYYTVTYTSVDRAGNPASASYGFTVDNTSPVHNMYVLVENPSKFSSHKNNYVNPVGVFSSRPSQENYEYGQYYNYNVNVELNVFDYNLDWVYVTDNDVEITPTWTWNGAYGTAVVTLQTEGYHELKLWSKDLSGNETNDTEAGKKIRLYIDKTSPTITTYVNSSLYTEGSGIRYLNTNANVSVSVNDTYKDSSDLVRTVRMTPPGGSTSVTTENVNETTESFATEADYEVTYVATDMAGNQSATRTVQFRVDKTPPQLSIADGGGTSTASSVAVSFNIKEAFYWDMNSVKISIYKKRDGSGEVLEKTMDFTPRSANDSFSYTLTEDAEYRFEFSAEDKCGNKTEVKGQLIKDGTAPIILLSGVSNYDKTDKNVTLNVSVDEAFYTSNKVTLTGTRTDIDGKTTNIDFSQFVTNRTKVSQLEQLFDEDGIYDITITSTDKAGNTSSKSVHFTIDTTDPVIGDLSKYDGVKVNKFSWDIDLDDLVTDLTVCDISVYMDGALYDGTSEISDGSHVLKVEAVDELGHKSFKEVTFVLDTKGPNIIISNVENGDKLLEATDVTVTVELDEDVLDTVSLNDKAVSVSDNKATITVNSKGTYKLTATAHDEAGNTSSTEISFSFGKQANLVLIGVIAGIAILLLLILLVLLRRRREN